jgi:hypothetical protein
LYKPDVFLRFQVKTATIDLVNVKQAYIVKPPAHKNVSGFFHFVLRASMFYVGARACVSAARANIINSIF